METHVLVLPLLCDGERYPQGGVLGTAGDGKAVEAAQKYDSSLLAYTNATACLPRRSRERAREAAVRVFLLLSKMGFTVF